MDSWSTYKWTDASVWEPLLATAFRVAKPLGGSCTMPLGDYLRYARLQRDEEPLYIFDEAFGRRAPDLLRDYRIPDGTPDDLFAVLGRDRPDFRWLVMGPVRSGSSWHQDPSGTCAWNALVAGRKRWLCYPPDVVPPGVQVTVNESGDQEVSCANPVTWLLEAAAQVLPGLSAAQRPHEHVQRAGEIIFLPSRWWHLVLNLEDTVAVTQNFVPRHGLSAAVAEVARGSGPRVAGTATGFRRSRKLGAWLAAISKAQPDLAEQAVALAEEHAALSEWAAALSGVCEVAGVAEPPPHECFPISGGPSVVFRVGDGLLVKFYTRDAPMNALDAYAEISALQCVAASSETPQGFPRLVLASPPQPAGLLAASAAQHQADEPLDGSAGCDAELPISALPWAVLSVCAGEPVGALNDVTEEIAAAVGQAVARLHILGGNIGPAASGSFFKDEDAWLRSLARGGDEWAAGGEAWAPFERFLGRRRRELRAAFHSEAVLPLRLVEGLEAYLPQDVADLVGPQTRRAGPVLLHGDLSPGNILVDAGGGAAAVSIIDFGDAGWGDPLFDLPPLHFLTFRGEPALTTAFLRAYCRLWQDGPPEWLRPRQGLSLSRVAMCYTMMHEQDILSSVFERRPELWDARSLEALQEDVLGFLDSASADLTLQTLSMDS